jgi:hypothetical protein
MQLWEQTSTSTGGFCGEVTEQAFQILVSVIRRIRSTFTRLLHYDLQLYCNPAQFRRQTAVRSEAATGEIACGTDSFP